MMRLRGTTVACNSGSGPIKHVYREGWAKARLVLLCLALVSFTMEAALAGGGNDNGGNAGPMGPPPTNPPPPTGPNPPAPPTDPNGPDRVINGRRVTIDPVTGQTIDAATGQPVDPDTGEPVQNAAPVRINNSEISELGGGNAYDENAGTAYDASRMSAANGMLYTLKGLALLNSEQEKAGMLLKKGVTALQTAEELADYAEQNMAVKDRMASGVGNEAATGVGSGSGEAVLNPDPGIMSSSKADGIYEAFDNAKYPLNHEKMIEQMSANGANTQKMEQSLELPSGAINEAIASSTTLTPAEQLALLNDPNNPEMDAETAAMLAALKKEGADVLGAENGEPEGSAAGGVGGAGGNMGENSLFGSLVEGMTGLSGQGAGNFPAERATASLLGIKKDGSALAWGNAHFLGSSDLSLFKRVRAKHKEKEELLRKRK